MGQWQMYGDWVEDPGWQSSARQEKRRTQMKTTKHHLTVQGFNGNEGGCPIPLHVIPNHMGINLCSVASIEWERQEDAQLVSLTIRFIPAPTQMVGG